LSKVLRRKRIEINNYKAVWYNENGAHIILKIGWKKKKKAKYRLIPWLNGMGLDESRKYGIGFSISQETLKHWI
jgi:hypothetical protein